MTYTVEFDPPTEARLAALAREKGTDARTLIKELVSEHLPPAPPVPDEENQRLIDMLQSWREEDETDDEEELLRRDAETAELLTNVAANRVNLGSGDE